MNEWTASPVWQYSSGTLSVAFGDVQRLDNGNTLVTYSTLGIIEEVSPEGYPVRRIETDAVGYVRHHSSLYGAAE